MNMRSGGDAWNRAAKCEKRNAFALKKSDKCLALSAVRMQSNIDRVSVVPTHGVMCVALPKRADGKFPAKRSVEKRLEVPPAPDRRGMITGFNESGLRPKAPDNANIENCHTPYRRPFAPHGTRQSMHLNVRPPAECMFCNISPPCCRTPGGTRCSAAATPARCPRARP